MALLSWDQLASPFFCKRAKCWHIPVPLGGWEHTLITWNFDNLCLNWGLKRYLLDDNLLNWKCLQLQAAEPVCKHVLCPSSSQCLCSFLGQAPEAALLFQPLPFCTYVGDGVSVELCDRFHPFYLCDQFVVALHLHNNLVEDRSVRVIAGDHLDPCILSLPCRGRRGLQSHLSCTSQKATDSSSTPRAASLINEINQIKKTAKPISV